MLHRQHSVLKVGFLSETHKIRTKLAILTEIFGHGLPVTRSLGATLDRHWWRVTTGGLSSNEPGDERTFPQGDTNLTEALPEPARVRGLEIPAGDEGVLLPGHRDRTGAFTPARSRASTPGSIEHLSAHRFGRFRKYFV